MPILNTKPVSTKDNTRLTNDIERKFRSQTELSTSLIFSDDKDLLPITQYVGGIRWSVDYFKQIKDVNDSSIKPDPNLTPTVQKYHRINDLVIYVQDAINQTLPSDIEGSAYINAGFMPSPGDTFKAVLTGGREGLFTVDTVENNTYNIHQCFLIHYKLNIMIDSSPKAWNDLQFKTVATYYYNKDYIMEGTAPIVLYKDYMNVFDLKVVRLELIRYYLNKFTNNKDTATLIHIDNDRMEVLVDPYLEEFFLRMVNVSDNSKLVTLTRVYVPEDSDVDYTIWNLLIDRNAYNFNIVESDLCWSRLKNNESYVTTRNLVFMGVKGIIAKGPKMVYAIPSNTKKTDDVNYKEPIGDTSNSYVFSKAFYNRDRTKAFPLEKACLDYMENKVIDKEILFKFIREYPYWETENQYYGIPILLMLIKDFITTTWENI